MNSTGDRRAASHIDTPLSQQDKFLVSSGNLRQGMSQIDLNRAGSKIGIDAKIATLRENKCSLAICKSVLQQGREDIYNCYNEGDSSAALIRMQTVLTDTILLEWWNTVFSTNDTSDMALIAVGGYGRMELHPYSDIDISVLVTQSPSPELAEKISEFITRLWDIGFDIGNTVRTVKQAQEVARADLSIITNLMESRLLTGSDSLFNELQEVIAPNRMWPAEEFFHAKMEEQRGRREKFHSNAYRLEPNLKESNGGLRDIQTVHWICQRQFGTTEFEELVTENILTKAEFNTLLHGLDTLWRIRYLLHHFAGKREDRLLFDFQRDLAHAWGFTDDTNNRCIEQLMQRFYRNAMRLQSLNEIILQGIGGVISGVTASTKPTEINSRFQLRNGFLEVKHDRVFINYPPALLEIFLIYGETPDADKIRSNTVRLIGAHLDLIDDSFRGDMQVRDLFLQIFRQPAKLTRKIRMMTHYGVLAAYLPAFDRIVGRMQYDLFHIYTVDEHTTRVIRNLRRFALPEFSDEMPHCSDIMSSIEKPELLYLVGLFHDIAKGRGGDHSELGAIDAEEFCDFHGLGKADTGLVAWVVRHHLLMSTTAQRKDISDVEVIREFAELVSSMKHLNHLYLLTVSDIRATNPELWNSFKQNLLRDLYESTRRRLLRGLDNPLDKDEVLEQKKKEALLELSSSEFPPSQVHSLWDQLGDSYYLRYQPVEIARHTTTILAHDNSAQPLISLRTAIRRGSTEVFIYMPDHDNLIATVTAVLGNLNLDIQSAVITTTSSGYALDTFFVLDDAGKIIRESSRVERIRTTLLQALSDPDSKPTSGFARPPRIMRHFDIKPLVEFNAIENSDQSSVYIDAMDRLGLLSAITKVFSDTGLQIHDARIVTLGERIEDMFFVSDKNGEALKNEEFLDQLRERLLAVFQP